MTELQAESTKTPIAGLLVPTARRISRAMILRYKGGPRDREPISNYFVGSVYNGLQVAHIVFLRKITRQCSWSKIVTIFVENLALNSFFNIPSARMDAHILPEGRQI